MRRSACLPVLLPLLLILPGRPVAADEAQELLLAQGCRACHVIGAGGGDLGPSLQGVGRRLNPHELRRHLTEPKAFNPESGMPDYRHLAERDIELLIRLLQQQP